MIQFMPHQDRSYSHIISQPRLSNITYIFVPQTNFDDGQMGCQMKHIQGTGNIFLNTYAPKLETVGVNTQTQKPQAYAICTNP